MTDLNCFKAYDIRGRVPDELNEDIAYHSVVPMLQFLTPKQVAVGGDVRQTSEALYQALVAGLTDSGADVFDIGLCGTEEILFRHFSSPVGWRHYGHRQPQSMDYNGMKLVREGADRSAATAV
ncbi:MAG: hypothetical protein R2864_09585 [Syntrophotaleaceae bacterium]